MRIVTTLMVGVVVVFGLVMSENLTAQTVTFEQAWFTDNWTENSINWSISRGDIRGYWPHSGSMHWSAWGAFTDNLTASACINVSGLWLYIDNSFETMSNFSIQGYDANDNVIGTKDITISEYEGNYGWISLNWNYITKLQVSWQDEEAMGSGFIDDFGYCINPPDITFTNGANALLSFSQTAPSPPQDNWPFGQFSLTSATTSSQLSSVTVSLGGSYSGLNGSNPFRLYASNTNNFSGASAIGSDAAASGGSVTFSSLNDALPSGTRYYWVTADLSSNASGTINGTISDSGSLSYTSGSGESSGSSNYGQLNTGGDSSLPVELSSFSARLEGRSVVLAWVTESETDNAGFILERREGGGTWTQIASYQTHDALKGQGNTSSRTEYTFTDLNVAFGKEYFYRLSDVGIRGEITAHPPLSIRLEELPETTTVENAYPNPFNPQTHIAYHLAETVQVKITIFDMLGCSVKELYNGWQPTGSYHVYWNGTNENGMKASSGVYIIHVQTDNTTKIQKVMFMK